MLDILKDRTYRHLFLAQVVALLGTGLATVALGLLAYDLEGGRAGAVLGTIFTIKMVAYVGLSPFAAALAEHLPRRAVLVTLDLVRAGVALCLPFVSEVWQVYVLIFLLQAASAGFTPSFQATIPDVLPEEDRYTRALSLSRLAYDLESIISPSLAALLLVFMSYHALFVGTLFGFLASAVLVVSVVLPSHVVKRQDSFGKRARRGIRIYLATPRLRGLLAFNLVAASGGAMVLVNTVVIVRDGLARSDSSVALALGAFGLGSMAVALVLPRLLDRVSDRTVMQAGALTVTGVLIGLALLPVLTWQALLFGWLIAGLGYSAILTPSGRVLKRSSHAEDRPALFAAQFALSHACWLMTYPLAGWGMALIGSNATLLLLAGLGAVGVILAQRLWPKGDVEILEHRHDDLPPDHPHLKGAHLQGHRHAFVIDDLHGHWPVK